MNSSPCGVTSTQHIQVVYLDFAKQPPHLQWIFHYFPMMFPIHHVSQQINPFNPQFFRDLPRFSYSFLHFPMSFLDVLHFPMIFPTILPSTGSRWDVLVASPVHSSPPLAPRRAEPRRVEPRRGEPRRPAPQGRPAARCWISLGNVQITTNNYMTIYIYILLYTIYVHDQLYRYIYIILYAT
jgi:hypothetical protein